MLKTVGFIHYVLTLDCIPMVHCTYAIMIMHISVHLFYDVISGDD